MNHLMFFITGLLFVFMLILLLYSSNRIKIRMNKDENFSVKQIKRKKVLSLIGFIPSIFLLCLGLIRIVRGEIDYYSITLSLGAVVILIIFIINLYSVFHSSKKNE